jgi:type VI secretion system protein ImpI
MTLVLTLEGQGAAAARERERRLSGGRLTIGRGVDNDWVLPDPERHLSRQHCIVEARGGSWSVTDTSSNGLYVDDAARPLGRDNSAALRDGSYLRLGEHVLRVSIEAEVEADARPAPSGGSLFDDEPLLQPESPDPAPRQRSEGPALGNLLDESWIDGRHLRDPEHPVPRPKDERPATRDDHLRPEHQAYEPPGRSPQPAEPEPTADEPEPPPHIRARGDGPFFDAEPSPPEPSPPEPSLPGSPTQGPPQQPAPTPPPPAATAALLIAFLEGAGLPEDTVRPGEEEATMREIGETFRALAGGLAQLLTSRAMVKREIGLEQTLIGASGNNPLKLSANAEEAALALIRHRGTGYLEPRAAIDGAFEDLKAHELAMLDGLQSALDALLRRFDPEDLEQELTREGLLASLIAGGHRARLWEAYKTRYGIIADGARERFLGDLGADFARAYHRRSSSR